MTIEINIPNGKMRIDADTFLKEAGIRNIRKMLKYLSLSWPHEEQAGEIKNWLREQLQAEADKQKVQATAYMKEKSRLSELEETYRRMQSPCYTDYTRNPEKLEQARSRVGWSRWRCKEYMKGIKQAKKAMDRYQKILQDAEKILWDEKILIKIQEGIG